MAPAMAVVDPVAPVSLDAGATTQIESAEPAPPFQKLNRFQRAMALWDQVHPYNAVHAVTVAGEVDPKQLIEAIRTECRLTGIGALRLEAGGARFAYETCARIELTQVDEVVAAGQGWIAEVLGDEMNRRFPDAPHHPIRWMLMRSGDGKQWTLAAAYHHVASDAHGILFLLGRIIRRYFDAPVGGDELRLHTEAVPFVPDRRGSGGSFGYVRSMIHSAGTYFALRRAHRMHEKRNAPSDTGAVGKLVEGAFAKELRRFCKSRDVGANDVFLAALVKGIADMTPRRREHRRRRKIALAGAVNLRPWSSTDLSSCFGTYVGHSVVLVDEPDASVDVVLGSVARQMAVHKAQRRAAAPAWPLILARYAWPMLGVRQDSANYRRLFPLCAGVSTVRVDPQVFGSVADRVVDYVRTCPPGPAMPMVLAPTMFRDKIHISLVHRLSVLDPNAAGELLGRVVGSVEGLLRTANLEQTPTRP